MTGQLAGKKVLVTGADGFIGSHLTERLVTLGAEVHAFCLYNSMGGLGWLDQSSTIKQIKVHLGDIRDAHFVESCVEGMDVVFHLAALIAIPYSYVAPESFVDTNIRGTMNILEACRRHRVSRLIHTSTSEVYGTPEHTPITEKHPLNAQSPYAATKVAADQLVQSYHLSYEVPTVILRPFNTYGPRQSTRAVLPTMLAQMIGGRTKILLGRTDTKRDLTFVSDTVEGFVQASMVPGAVGKTIQLGTGRTVSIDELFAIAKTQLDTTAVIEHDPKRMRPEGSEVMILLSDPAYAKEVLHWEPKVTLEDGVKQTIAWIKNNPALYSPDAFRL